MPAPLFHPPIIKYLDRSQVEAVIGAARGPRNQAMLALVYNCGLRRAEVGMMTRDCYKPGRGIHGMVLVPRLKKRGRIEWHEIMLWRRTAYLLKKYLATRKDMSDALFLSRKHVSMTAQAVYYVFRDAAIRAGVPKDRRSPKAFRHSIAVHCMNMGADPVDIQNHLGHSSINSTLIYAKVLTPRKSKLTIESEASHHFAKF